MRSNPMASARQVREIEQHYWRYEGLPHMELRSTEDSAQAYKSHSHNTFSIGALRAGRTRLSCGDTGVVIEPGDLVIIEPERVHACNPIDGGLRSYHMLYVDSDWCLEQLSTLFERPIKQLSCDQLVVKDPCLYRTFLSLIEHLQQGAVAGASALLDQMTLQLFAAYCSPVSPDETDTALSHQIKRGLLANLVQPPPLQQLAAELGVSRETVIRAFRKRYGITPKAFINNARIEKAKALLKAGASIVDVSMAVGFSDQSQFHRAFVAYTAATPRQYQQAGSLFDNI